MYMYIYIFIYINNKINNRIYFCFKIMKSILLMLCIYDWLYYIILSECNCKD